ncbi:MAG TPA: thioredoxin family protein [Epulopiscium sp.]|nr:thioredoxin family protein [Candidatus Epulonipiscium sp.]
MEIIILGTGCAKCKTTFDVVQSAVTDSGINATVSREEDILEIVKYNIMSLPAVVVDGEVKIKGYVPSKDEVLKIITE